MNITDILGGNILGGVKGIISQFVASPEDKLKAEAAAQSLIAQHAAAIEASYQKEIEAKQAIMVAELQQADLYTKRARPSIIYVGLGAIVANSVLLPWGTFIAAAAFGKTLSLPSIELPGEFYYAWAGVCGAYVLGRTSEKTGNALPFFTAKK